MPRKVVTQPAKISAEEAEICYRLREGRQRLGLSQRSAASVLKISVDTLKGYEYARSPIRYGFADKFCNALNINQRWLASGTRPWKPCFHISPELNELLPKDQPFSTVFNLVLLEPVEEFLRGYNSLEWTTEAIEENAPQWKHRERGIGPSWREVERFLVKNTTASVAAAFHLLPPDLATELYRHLATEIGDFLEQKKQQVIDFEDPSHGPRARFFQRQQHILQKFVAQKLGAKALPDAQASYQNLKSEIDSLASDLTLAAIPKDILQSPTKSGLTKTTEFRSSISPYENLTTDMQRKKLAQRITDAREKLNLTQSEAAEKWKISLGTLRDWEQCRTEPRGFYRERIEEILTNIERKHGK